MPRFLHTADWQIGRQYSRFDATNAALLAEARYQAIARLAQLAKDESCDAVLVAGDVFDTQTVSELNIRRVFNAMEAFSGPWVLLPGNHDAALSESVWTRAMRMEAVPDKVHLALAAGLIELETAGLAILCAPLTQRNTYDDLTAPFDNLDSSPGLVRIGLAHGSVQGVLAEDIDSTNPISATRVDTARLDYLALGDWHGAKRIGERCWYSGTPEPERFRNNDAGAALIVDIDAPGSVPTVSLHRTGQYDWQQWQRAMAVATDLDELVKDLEATPPHTVLDLKISGQLTLDEEQTLNRALSVAGARLRSLQANLSALAITPTEAEIAELHAEGYIGDVIQTLNEQQALTDDPAPRDALLILAGLLRERGTEPEASA